MPFFGTPCTPSTWCSARAQAGARTSPWCWKTSTSQGYHLQMPPAEDEYIEHLPEELLRRNDPV
jgi:hypothetical protein